MSRGSQTGELIPDLFALTSAGLIDSSALVHRVQVSSLLQAASETIPSKENAIALDVRRRWEQQQSRRAAAARERESRWSTIVELDEPIAVGSERQARFREYLNAGVELGFMTDAACAHPQGSGSLERMRLHSDLIEREFYVDVYAAVKGRYRIKPPLVRP